jgi:hypothetical protein
MAEQHGVTVGPDGLLRTAKGGMTSEYVDAVRSGIGELPRASIIYLRLYEQSEGTPGQPDATPETLGVQVRMTAQFAQILAHRLLALSSELRGEGHPRQ